MARPNPDVGRLVAVCEELRIYTGFHSGVPGEYASYIRICDAINALQKLLALKRHSRARVQARELFAFIAQNAIAAYLDSVYAQTTVASPRLHAEVPPTDPASVPVAPTNG